MGGVNDCLIPDQASSVFPRIRALGCRLMEIVDLNLSTYYPVYKSVITRLLNERAD
jgi:hypothetical protein